MSNPYANAAVTKARKAREALNGPVAARPEPVAARWDAELVKEVVEIFPEQADGTRKKITVVKRWVELTRGRETIVFKIGKGKGGFPVFTDSRAEATGAAPLTMRGPLPGEAYCKPGRAGKLTPTAWAEEVERMIGPEKVGEIFLRLINQGFTPG